MARAVHRERPSRGFCVAEAAVLAVILVLGAVSVLNLAAGHLETAAAALLAAAPAAAALFLLRLNWRLTQFNRALVTQNAKLLHMAAGKVGDDAGEQARA